MEVCAVKNLEEQEQIALFDWASHIPALRWFFSIPNGAFLHGNKIQRARQMAKLKRQGLKPGIWDCFLPLARNGYHGLWIEFKASTRKNHLSNIQSEFGAAMMAEGYLCHVCYGTEEAISVIKNYLNLSGQ